MLIFDFCSYIEAFYCIFLSIFAIGYIITLLYFLNGLRRRTKPPEKLNEKDLPFVTIQAPIYNEGDLPIRLIEAICALNYPKDKYELQILDDSTDDTPDIIQDYLKKNACPIFVDHIRRSNRVEFKAGALKCGLPRARGTKIAVFDVDFVPPPSFLYDAIPYFNSQAKVGCVQTRWGHLNREHSLITCLQAIGIDGHFVIEQQARFFNNFLLNFNGTCGIWDIEAIRDAGDWCGDTLAEDLDLSYRAQLKGWKIVYVPSIIVPGELPTSLSEYKIQQTRWARGSVQVARKLLPKIFMSNNVTLGQKLYSCYHLLSYCLFTGLLALMILALPTAFSSIHVFDGLGSIGHTYLLLMGFGPPACFLASLIYIGRLMDIKYVPIIFFVGYVLSINNTLAVLRGFLDKSGSSGTFVRTPKTGIAGKGSKVTNSRHKKTLAIKEEILFLLLLLVSLTISWVYNGDSYKVMWLIIYCISFIFMIGLELKLYFTNDRKIK